MIKFDKFSIVMLGAIVLAIAMLIYNPIQQQFLLTQLKQIVTNNNEILTNQSREMQNQSHMDQLQRQLEHTNITTIMDREEAEEHVEHAQLIKNQKEILAAMINQSVSQYLLSPGTL